MLLASFDRVWPTEDGAGWAPADAVELALSHLRENEFIPTEIGRGLFWLAGQSGTVEFNSRNCPAFAGMVGRISDGLDNEVFSSLYVGHAGVGGPRSESIQFGFVPDLVGNAISSIRLTVREVEIIPFQHPTLGSRIHVGADLTYEFWGTPVPEPSTIGFLGFVGMIWLRRCKLTGDDFAHRS